MQEIEKKFKIKELPDLTNISYKIIKQGYLNTDSEPVLRIRQLDDKYFLTYKYTKEEDKKININKCAEYELPITKEAFEHLMTKIDGILINKKRYKVPIDNLVAEIDIFTEKLDGLKMVEVEFSTEEDAQNFIKPDWFGEEVTSDKRYRNAYLAIHYNEVSGKNGKI